MIERTRLQALEALLPVVMRADVAWAAHVLGAAHKRLRAGKGIDDLLAELAARLESSAARFEARARSVPQPHYQEDLPILARREDLVRAIATHPVLIVAGETGSGKTTQLPQFCLEAGRGRRGLIGCTQPRRIAARAMAERVSEELGSPLGEAVGYQVRFREKINANSLVKFMTDGILLAETLHDRSLDAYDTLIVDEAHERSLNIDFLLGYLKQLLPRRPDLRVIITSATIDTEQFSKHFDGAPIIEVSGRGHPVDIVYQPVGDEAGESEQGGRDMYRGIADAVGRVSRIDPRGDILVFLSGEREIREAMDYLQRKGLRHTEVMPLYARLSAAEQHRVFHPGPERRIILATNIAETSLTVPRIRFVIDTGFARISRYAHRSRIQRLPVEPVSQASAQQRAGRCGRIGPGTCVRLYSQQDFDLRPEFTEPEILRTSLASVILRMLTMGLGAVEDFPFLDAPAPRMISDAMQLLFELGAVDDARAPTDLGRRMARWPLDVRLARMVLEGAERDCLEDMLVLAAGLSIQDPRERPLDARQAADAAHARFADPQSDFAGLLKLWAHLKQARRAQTGNQFRKWCRREYLGWQRVLEWFDLVQQLRDQAREEGLALHGGHAGAEPLHRCLLSGLLSNVGLKHPEEPAYIGARNRRFHIFPGSGLFGSHPRWLMAAEIVETSRPYARGNAAIKPEWIEQQGAHLLQRSYSDPRWSRRRGQVMADEQVSLYGLVLVERRSIAYARVNPGEAREIFIRDALAGGQLDARHAFLQHNAELRATLQVAEHKRRRRDVLVDERQLAAWFDRVLPAQVNSAKTLAKWLERGGRQGQQKLMWQAQDLLRDDAALASAQDFPDWLDSAGHPLELVYRFEPGAQDDGVTVRVPLEWLNTLDEGRLQWLVPGMLEEKVEELLRGLPKPTRRALTPVPQFARLALDRIAADRGRALCEALADALNAETGLGLAAEQFEAVSLPEHLRFRYAVLDDTGQALAASRDLAALRARFGLQARRRFMDRQGGGWNRDGETDWVFATLPRSIQAATGGTAWPALVDQQDSVGLRLFDTHEEAAWSQLEGVRRLLALQLDDKLDYLRTKHGLRQTAAAAWSAWGSMEGLHRDLAWSSLCAVADETAVSVRDAGAFTHLVAETRRKLGPEFQQRAELLSSVLEQASGLSREIDALPAARAAARNDLRSQLDDLVYDGFLADLEPARLQHYPRYLQGMRQRLDRIGLDPQRDARLLAQVEAYWTRYLAHLASGQDYGAALDQFRWLIEEYRVSLFAQILGTDEKVSPKRLEQAWTQVLEASR
jgi:ATP-dependent helicase HrpA